MRRTGTAILAVAMLLLAFVPAAAAKKPVVDDPPTYTAEISFAGNSGIASTCLDDEGDPMRLQLTRTDERNGPTHFEKGGARLDIAGDLLWDDAPVIGCRGNHVWPEYFRITLNDDGTIAMLWIFDVEETERIITLKNGKTKVETVRTDFRMGGPYDDGNFAETVVAEEPDGTLTFAAAGAFAFVRYDSQVDEMMAPLGNSPQEYSLTITLTRD